MKKSIKWFSALALMMICAMTFTACGSDDDGGSGGSGSTGGAYVGEWVSVTSYAEDDYYVDVLKLNSNGTGTQTLYHLSEYEAIYEVANFTYSVSGSQITVKSPGGSFTGNYAMGTYDGSKYLAITVEGKMTTYIEMTSETRSLINAFNPVPGDVH